MYKTIEASANTGDPNTIAIPTTGNPVAYTGNA